MQDKANTRRLRLSVDRKEECYNEEDWGVDAGEFLQPVLDTYKVGKADPSPPPLRLPPAVPSAPASARVPVETSATSQLEGAASTLSSRADM